METTKLNATEQFVQDYLLIAENDYRKYRELRELAEELSTLELAEYLQEEYDTLTDTLLRSMGVTYSGYSEFQQCLMIQLLQGWGSDAFYKIALHVKRED